MKFKTHATHFIDSIDMHLYSTYIEPTHSGQWSLALIPAHFHQRMWPYSQLNNLANMEVQSFKLKHVAVSVK
jgi:hypothetical protein